MNITLHLPSTARIDYFFIETDRFVFKITSSNNKTEVTDESRRPENHRTVSFSSIEDFRIFINTLNMQTDDVIFCVSFLAQLKDKYP